ncbi:MAG: indolepyruvate oxidoreductase subunit beta [Spirochaetales bacterium]|nr:indolepyruvate oxidoreductase subunit beta [Spirochaetales bacterium]
MKFDIVLAGVGGQGVLSLAAIIAKASMLSGHNVRQSEVHGMSQRGGAVMSHLRISDDEIAGDLVPRGSADLILAMEPMESLRYLEYIKPTGTVVTAIEPINNIAVYPDIEKILGTIKSLPSAKMVNSVETATAAGSARAANMVLIGAAAQFLPLERDALISAIKEIFNRKGQEIVNTNIKAFELGEQA